MKRVSGAVALLLLGCGPTPLGFTVPEPDNAPADCATGTEEVQPDQVVQGIRVGALLEPYFGTYEGKLRWQDGPEHDFVLDLPYVEGEPYRLGNVYMCVARQVFYDSSATLWSSDGTYDQDLTLHVTDFFNPEFRGNVTTGAVLVGTTLENRAPAAWPEELTVDLSRYASHRLALEFDWPKGDASPRSASITFEGTLQIDPKLSESFLAGTVTF